MIDNIRVIGEDRKAVDVSDRYGRILEKSDIVYILGFGFDDANMSVIQLQKIPETSKVYVTNFGNDKKINSIISQSLPRYIVNIFNDDCLGLLEKVPISFRFD